MGGGGFGLGDGGKPRGARFRSRGVRTESDLEPGVFDLLHGVVCEGHITPGLQNTTCEVFERAQGFAFRFSEKTAVIEQLSNGMGDLQKIVEYLRCIGIGSIGVLQTVSPRLLGVKSLILNLPSSPPGIISHGDYVCFGQLQVGNPLPLAWGWLASFVRLGFSALKEMECVLSLFRVGVEDLVYPSELLAYLSIFSRTK